MSRKRSLVIPGVDRTLLVRDAAKAMPELSRRRFLAGGASLGALTLLTGCDVTDSFSAEALLTKISKFNDAVQAKLFDPDKLAQTYRKARSRGLPVQRYYALEDAPTIDGRNGIRGRLVDDKRSWTLEELYTLPQESRSPARLRRGWRRSEADRTRLRHFLTVAAETAREIRLVQLPDYDGYNYRSTWLASCIR